MHLNAHAGPRLLLHKQSITKFVPWFIIHLISCGCRPSVSFLLLTILSPFVLIFILTTSPHIILYKFFFFWGGSGLPSFFHSSLLWSLHTLAEKVFPDNKHFQTLHCSRSLSLFMCMHCMCVSFINNLMRTKCPHKDRTISFSIAGTFG